MSEEPELLQPLTRAQVAKMTELIFEFNTLLSHMDMATDDPRFIENMASIRVNADSIGKRLAAPFQQLSALATAEASKVMATNDDEKVKTAYGTFYFTHPTKAVYVKDADSFIDKMQSNPDLFRIIEPNLTITAKSGGLSFMPAKK